jgi:peptidyl-prolyl cis-trans isomerase B (cyclophilin B)
MIVRFATNQGDLDIELHHDKAPVTAENFAQYVRDGHYDGTIFHRVIPGFMVQGGGFMPGMKQKPTREEIKNEADNGLKNVIGSVAMARTAAPHSASAQFFINVEDNEPLNFKSPTQRGWGYCVFATVVAGMDTIDQMTDIPTGSAGGHGDVPREDIVVDSATILEQ